MFKVRFDENSKLKISTIPKQHSIFSSDNNKMYYLGTGKYDSQYSKDKLNPELSYFIGIKINISEDILYITEDIYYLAFNDKYELIDKVKVTEGLVIPRLNLKDIILWEIFIASDIDSAKGRRILLENILFGFDTKKNNIPEKYKLPTKSRDITFCKRNDKAKVEYVPLDKVVGLKNPSYEGLSWFETFINLKRCRNIYEAVIEPEYYSNIELGSIIPQNLSFDKIDDEYYISIGAHRVTIAILKGLNGIYAPITHYRTSKFHENCFNKIEKLGFKIELCGDKYDKESWEVFKVSISDKSILLLNEEMIYEFIMKYEELDVSDFSIKIRQAHKTIKKIIDLLIKEKHSDERRNEKYVKDAILNFFLINNYSISELKLKMLEEKESSII
ncbi:MAG: hypothetical protein E7222_05545 [Clostridiales bacterium]|nr:hypothetical protein [Clostridiales bacterium]